LLPNFWPTFLINFQKKSKIVKKQWKPQKNAFWYICINFSIFNVISEEFKFSKVFWTYSTFNALIFLIWFFLFFFVFLKATNINVDSTRKISDCKIYALKVERIENTFENLNPSEMTLKMLKMMQIYQNAFFEVFIGFFAIFGFFWKFIKNMGQN